MIIPIASDHAGFEAKKVVKRLLEERNITTIDYGTNSSESVDYPDFAVFVAQAVNNGDNNLGILICGSGQGMCMTANKYPNVRAALAWNKEMAQIARQHNNANILCLPGRFVSEDELKEILFAWLDTGFEGGRHQSRIDKMSKKLNT